MERQNVKTGTGIFHQLSQLDEGIYLLWSKHCTTFPKVPSPKVSCISSVKQIEVQLRPDGSLLSTLHTASPPTSILKDVPALVDQVATLSVPLTVACSVIAAPLEKEEFVTGGATEGKIWLELHLTIHL